MGVEVSIYDPETDSYLAGALDPATGEIVKDGDARITSPHHCKTKAEAKARDERVADAIAARAEAAEEK